MALRSTRFNGTQVGVEAAISPGVVVVASKRLRGIVLENPRPIIGATVHRANGSKAAAGVSHAKEESESGFGGPLCFNDILYYLRAAFTKRTGFVYSPETYGPETIRTMTFEHGSSAGAERIPFGYVNAISFEFNREECTVNGTVRGAKMIPGATLTPTPTDVPIEIADASMTGVYAGNSVAGLARVKKYLRVGLEFSGIRNGFTDLDETSVSIDDTFEGEFSHRANVTLVNDAAHASLIADLRAKQTKVFRVINTGREFGVGTPFKFIATFAGKLTEPGVGDEGGIYGGSFNIEMVHSSELASFCTFEVLTDYTDAGL